MRAVIMFGILVFARLAETPKELTGFISAFWIIMFIYALIFDMLYYFKNKA